MEIGTKVTQHIHTIIYNEGQFSAAQEAQSHIQQIIDEYDPDKHNAENLLEELRNFLSGHQSWLSGLNTSSTYHKEKAAPLLLKHGTNGLTHDPNIPED